MADSKISALTAHTTVSDSDELVIVDNSGTATSKKITKKNLVKDIVNVDVASSAAIDFSKLAALTSASILVGNGSNVATSVAISGDIAIDNAGATTIQTDAVDIAMLSATGTASSSTYLRGDNTWGAVTTYSAPTIGSTPIASGATVTTIAGLTLTSPTLTFAINAQTGTTYTPVLADAGKIVTLNNGSAITLTIPPNSSVAYPVGSSLTFISIGAGLTTFAQGSGVTIASAGGTATAPIITAQHNSATAIKIATDTWQVVGALT